MNSSEIEVLRYMVQCLSEGNEDELDIERFYGLGTGFLNYSGESYNIGDVIFTVLINSGSTKVLRIFNRIILSYPLRINITPQVIYLVLKGADNDFVIELAKLISKCNINCIELSDIVSVAAEMKQYDLVRGLAGIMNEYNDQKLDIQIVRALASEDYLLLSALTNDGVYLTQFKNVRSRFGSQYGSRWLLDEVILYCVRSADNFELDLLSPTPRIALERIGILFGTTDAVETLIYCLGEDDREEKINNLTRAICNGGIFFQEHSDEYISRLNETAEIIAASGICPSEVSYCVELLLCNREMERTSVLEALRPLLPDKITISNGNLYIDNLKKFSAVYDGELVFSLDDNTGGIPLNAMYIVQISRYIKLEYTGNFEKNEDSIMAHLLRTQSRSLIKRFISLGLIGAHNADRLMDFCVEEKLYKVISMLNENGL